MLIRSYTGRTLQEALEKVKQQLGDQALIIETRPCKEPGMLGKKTGYEVIAAVDSAEPRQPTSAPRTSFQLQPLRSREQNSNFEQEKPTHNSWQPIQNPKLDQYAKASNQQVETTTTHDHTGRQAAVLSAAAEQAKILGQNDHDLISHELCSIRRQLARLAAGQALPTQHIGEDLHQQLKDAELPDEIIAELDDVLAQAGDRLPENKREAFMKRYLHKTIQCEGLDWDQCKHLVIVGPTGVGKTTTLAKIAGDMVLNHQRRIAMVTIDTYRVGAAEQLRAYADLLDVPFEIAQTPAQLERLMQKFKDYDHVLIDTAGRSPADSTKVQELKAFCRAAPQCSVMLAIAANSGRAEFAAVIERFSILPIEHCVMTKMDELASPGRLLGCIRRHQLPVQLITTGQEVPEDLHPAEPSVFVDSLFTQTSEPCNDSAVSA